MLSFRGAQALERAQISPQLPSSTPPPPPPRTAHGSLEGLGMDYCMEHASLESRALNTSRLWLEWMALDYLL